LGRAETGGAELLADLETRLECGGEQFGGIALRELSTNVGAVAGLLEQVGVGVTGSRSLPPDTFDGV
jgi:hypothetical protein